jgi:DNA-binding transcriptional ArsR family regulator/membrane protease YdiL (CAAX protease family)
LAIWAAAGAVALVVLAQIFPVAFELFPREWSINRNEARAIALERLQALGEPVEDGLVIPVQLSNGVLEKRLAAEVPEVGAETVRESDLGAQLLQWQVAVYEPGARPYEWRYRARVSTRGEVTELRLRIPEEEELPEIDPGLARRQADAFLTAQGFELADFGEPVVRRVETEKRANLTLRYRPHEQAFGDVLPYGVEVSFAGDQLTGFSTWWEDEQENDVQAALQPINLFEQFRLFVPFLVFPFVAAIFLRRYHAGEVGVRRSVHLFLLTFGAGAVLVFITALPTTESFNFGLLSRVQTAWVWGFQLLILWFSAVSLLAAISWSVGEAFARELWPGKLAAFDALFQRHVGNATVAESSLRGLSAGFALAALLIGLLAMLPAPLGDPTVGAVFGPWWEDAAWPALGLIAAVVSLSLYRELFGRLFLLSSLAGRFGRWGAAAVTIVLSTFLFWPFTSGASVPSSILMGLVGSTVLVVLFLRYDLLTTLIASVTTGLTVSAMPYLLADDAFLQLQGVLPLLFAALPMLLSVRHLLGDKRFVYRWEDVPPHVRRIAERERQRVELETARRIQSSILPELPPQLNGVEVAHAYLPASEVGGDFYDVLALEDGRLALAVGDVAGHGVSSGLVMSMAKSALAVQVTFSPEVSDVFKTLNRTVYQTARKRLLATLCYAVLDPKRRQLLYASAGHLFPYRIDREGRVEPLESISYPLGVREDISVIAKEAHLEPEDTLFLFSDGIVEARREGGDEQFGFDRLEATLARLAHQPVGRIRDGVLAEVDRFAGQAPREDDQTVLVLRLPA